MFLHESQNEIHLPTIISVSNTLSLILVSDTNKCAYVSLIPYYKRSSCLPFSWTETDFPSFETDSLRSDTKKTQLGPSKSDVVLHETKNIVVGSRYACYARRTPTNMTSRQAARSHAKFLTLPLLLPVLLVTQMLLDNFFCS